MGLSIRWRLTLWNTVALAIVLLAFGGLVYGLMHHALYERVDGSLLTAWQELERKPDQNLAYWIKEAREHQNLFCLVYGPGGDVMERTEELPLASIVPALSGTVPQRDFFNVSLPIVGHQRAFRKHVQTPEKQYTVVLLAGLEEVDHELGELLVVLGMAVPLALGVAGGTGYLLARKALGPVRHLHRLTEEITADRLDRRLPVTNPGDELGSLTETINGMIGRLERSFAEVRRFTADASHELRTPLAVIRTEAEVALRRPMALADYHQLLGSILEECERLTRLTDQLLSLSREDAAKHILLEKVDLSALVQAVAESMRPLAVAKSLRLQVSGDGEMNVAGDAGRLRQVFYNLLDNAIKYTPQGGTIEVGFGARDGSAVVRVRDTGIGIPAEHVPRVFDRFYRVDKARSREQGGSGLGLSIAKAIVNAHGGQIELASTAGSGTTCTVTLPAEPNRQD